MAFNESLSHLLNERRIATLTTFSENGMPHVTAVWFLWQDGALYIATSHHTGKGRNLLRDARMALCIESREDGRESGMSASGEAELLRLLLGGIKGNPPPEMPLFSRNLHCITDFI